MIHAGTLLIQHKTLMPASAGFNRNLAARERTGVVTEAELVEFKESLAEAGLTCFYMAAVTQTVFGISARRRRED